LATRTQGSLETLRPPTILRPKPIHERGVGLSHKSVTILRQQRVVAVQSDVYAPALAVDLTIVAVPLVCTCIVAGVDPLPMDPLGMGLAFDLDLLLLDGGAVASPQVHDNSSGFFTSSDADLLG